MGSWNSFAIAKLKMSGTKPMDAIYVIEQWILDAKMNLTDFPMEYNVSMLFDEDHHWYLMALC